MVTLLDLYKMYNYGISQEAFMSLWVDATADMDEGLLSKSITAYLAGENCSFPPKPGHIRSIAAKQIMKDSGFVSTADAVAIVSRLLDEYGRNRYPQHENQHVMLAIRTCGWQAICDSRDFSYQFRSVYERICSDEMSKLVSIGGLSDLGNGVSDAG